jgi:hypothetical protein
MLRLLATATLELKTFMGEIPPYAILSHTWLEEGEEVTLDDLKHGIGKARSKKGYPKLKDSARLAWLKGFAYIWIDTCCIDKASSAELSEAINSMYRWYKDAAVCYAYLADVLNANDNVEFKHSRWFTRGWTLQATPPRPNRDPSQTPTHPPPLPQPPSALLSQTESQCGTTAPKRRSTSALSTA